MTARSHTRTRQQQERREAERRRRAAARRGEAPRPVRDVDELEVERIELRTRKELRREVGSADPALLLILLVGLGLIMIGAGGFALVDALVSHG